VSGVLRSPACVEIGCRTKGEVAVSSDVICVGETGGEFSLPIIGSGEGKKARGEAITV
jgi:hypothetical protein